MLNKVVPPLSLHAWLLQIPQCICCLCCQETKLVWGHYSNSTRPQSGALFWGFVLWVWLGFALSRSVLERFCVLQELRIEPCGNHPALIPLHRHKGAHTALPSFCTYYPAVLPCKSCQYCLAHRWFCMSEMCIWLATMLSDFTYNAELQGLWSLQACASSVEIETLKWEYKHSKGPIWKVWHPPALFPVLIPLWKMLETLKTHPCLPAYPGSL